MYVWKNWLYSGRAKNKSNQKKHKVSFEEARSAFYDQDAVVYDDPDHSLEEGTIILLGISFKIRILVVSYVSTEVNDGRGSSDFKISYGSKDKTIVLFIRIISARKANKEEKKAYGVYLSTAYQSLSARLRC